MSALKALLDFFLDDLVTRNNTAVLQHRNPDTRDPDYSLDRDIEIAKTKWPNVVLIQRSGGTTALRATLFGIRGGGRVDRTEYVVEVRLAGFPTTCPEAYVHRPTKRRIRHINVFSDGRICVSAFGRYQLAWASGEIPLGERNLVGFLTQVHSVLRGENHSSPAR